MFITDLAFEFRDTAKVFREHAQESVAIAYERCAEQLDLALTQADEESLTLRQASEETGYSQRYLRRGECRVLGLAGHTT